MKSPEKKQLQDFAEDVARMVKDGDMIADGRGNVMEHEAESCDEEVSALFDLISRARELTGVKPADLVKTPGERKRGLRAAVKAKLDGGNTMEAIALLWKIVDSLVDEIAAA